MLRRGMQAGSAVVTVRSLAAAFWGRCRQCCTWPGFASLFYSREDHEPRHVDVEHDDKLANYWLEPVELASSSRFRSHELIRLHSIVIAHRQAFLEAWDEHFGKDGPHGS